MHDPQFLHIFPLPLHIQAVHVWSVLLQIADGSLNTKLSGLFRNPQTDSFGHVEKQFSQFRSSLWMYLTLRLIEYQRVTNTSVRVCHVRIVPVKGYPRAQGLQFLTATFARIVYVEFPTGRRFSTSRVHHRRPNVIPIDVECPGPISVYADAGEFEIRVSLADELSQYSCEFAPGFGARHD